MAKGAMTLYGTHAPLVVYKLVSVDPLVGSLFVDSDCPVKQLRPPFAITFSE